MKLKRFNELNEKVEISTSEIKELFVNGKTVHRGLTDVEVKDDVLTISHSGNMGNSITHSVDPNLKSLGLPTIAELKKQYTVISEDGAPDYLYTIEFDLSDEKSNESVLNESKSVTENEFVDEFLDRLYMCGKKEDGYYILSLEEATDAAKQIFKEYLY